MPRQHKSFAEETAMTRNELEQLQQIVTGLNKAQGHIQYLLANHHESFIDKSSLRGLQNDLQVQIDELNKLFKTDT
ncbi:hypothetical protein ACIRA0001_2819 [Acinetobacter radioresistens SK82]|uniref:Uncharacterized protein n=2 Tax=Moraxellaceae TaxID=468 RepID=A0ABM9YMU0_ACIRA|nr:hypothetical protein [Acinetobacter radioresistens]EET82276.1 hypothetical protein ACIRA0001_2819 [Acinetobacter radioresistens SK82]EXE53477.1 hypothetical protein J579_3274 [Acinetobacter sp. 1239920]EXE54127.1 hypothetical protein J579_3215 [Acinetobacter sp. 1239920]HDG2063248.1 hypothetical protein [Staphylococcus aureus]